MSDCIFCKIINGEIPSAVIYEDNEFKVILDRFPSNEGHILILPKKHIKNIFEMDEETGAKLFKIAIKISKLMKKALNISDMNVLQNNGELSGQTIHHFHLHLIPRYKDDNINISWKCLDLTDDQIENMRKTLTNIL